jgi:hypothetical protein
MLNRGNEQRMQILTILATVGIGPQDLDRCSRAWP